MGTDMKSQSNENKCINMRHKRSDSQVTCFHVPIKKEPTHHYKRCGGNHKDRIPFDELNDLMSYFYFFILFHNKDFSPRVTVINGCLAKMNEYKFGIT